jgi:hypothetical protein
VSLRVCRWLLWAVFVVAMPVPLLVPLEAEVPAARILMLAAIGLLQMVLETTRGAVVQLTLLLFAQALLAMAGLWVFSYLATKPLARATSAVRTVATLAVIVTLLATASAVELYRDPFRSDTIRADLISAYR